MSEVTDQFKELYSQHKGEIQDLRTRLLAGQPLSDDELKVVALSFMQGEPGDRSISLVMSDLDKMERENPGSTQIKELQSQVQELSKLSPDEQKRAFITAAAIVTTLAAGPAMSFVREAAATGDIAAAGAAQGLTGEITPVLSSKLSTLGVRSLLKGLASTYGKVPKLIRYPLNVGLTLGAINKFGEGLAGSPEAAVTGATSAAQPQTGETTSTTQPAADTVEGDYYIITDPKTGASEKIPVSAFEQQAAVTGGVPDIAQSVLDFAAQFGIDASGMLETALGKTFNTNIYGDINVSPTSFPYGVDITSGESATEQTPAQTARKVAVYEQGVPGGADIRTADYVQNIVPPGADINPRALQNIPGTNMTFLRAVGEAAAQAGVPFSLLYALLNYESAQTWDPNVVGDNGTSFGLAQIHNPGGSTHPEVSKAQALNPFFAIQWAANNIARAYQKYGRWDAAVLYHNLPANAEKLAKTNEYPTQQAQTYVSNIFKIAQASGLGHTLFGDDYMATTVSGANAIGPYVQPDKSTLFQFLRQSYSQVLGREPTANELDAGTQILLDGYKAAYEESVKQAQGQQSTAINPEDRFMEQLQGTGEAAFTKERQATRSMFDHLGSIASALRYYG